MIQQVTRTILAAGILAVLMGCTTTGTSKKTAAGFSGGNSSGSQSRALEAGDGVEVSVEVDGHMEVTLHRAELNHQGVITLPLIGDVKVGGLKLAEARSVITGTYSAYYVNPPVIMLRMMDTDAVGEWGYVTVLGKVNKPGRVPLQSHNGINLSAAVQLAGGFAPSAKQSEIRVTRKNPDGNTTKGTIDFRQIGESGNADADILLIDGDIVFVPERIF